MRILGRDNCLLWPRISPTQVDFEQIVFFASLVSVEWATDDPTPAGHKSV